MTTRKARAWGLAAAMLLGLLMWLAGAFNLPRGTPVLSLAILVLGSVLAVVAGFLLLTSRPSGRPEHPFEGAFWFCASFGLGLASIGLSISPLTHWWLPALFFAVGGVALIAWAPQALERHWPRR